MDRKNINKIYCEKCNSVFESRKKYEKHLERHYAGITCEACPIDTVISKFVNLFKKQKLR